MFLPAVACAVALRWYLHQPSDEPSRKALDLSPYEVAYLQGGEVLTVNVAIARLIHANAVIVDSKDRKIKVSDREPPNAVNLERAIYSAAKVDGGESISAVRSAAASQLTRIRERLQNLGLYVTDDQAALARFIPIALVLLVPLFGIVKLFVGLSRDRPVGFLFILCLVSALVALGFAWPIRRSRRGDRALDHLKQTNAALRVQAGRRMDELAADDFVLGVGLFGLGVSLHGTANGLETAFWIK
jgi:uncharacterized protein (TIGR04222 family)